MADHENLLKFARDGHLHLWPDASLVDRYRGAGDHGPGPAVGLTSSATSRPRAVEMLPIPISDVPRQPPA